MSSSEPQPENINSVSYTKIPWRCGEPCVLVHLPVGASNISVPYGILFSTRTRTFDADLNFFQTIINRFSHRVFSSYFGSKRGALA